MLRAIPRWPASSSKRRTPLATSRSTSSVHRSPIRASVLAIEQVSLSYALYGLMPGILMSGIVRVLGCF